MCQVFTAHNNHIIICFTFCLADGEDFNEPDTFEVTFSGGSTSDGDSSCIQIPIVNDLQFEGNEQLFQVDITGTNLPNVMCNTDCTASVQIMDDESDSK